jgi:molecular chaperone DnaK (HSP70)
MEPPPLTDEQIELMKQEEEAAKAKKNPKKTRQKAEMKVLIETLLYYTIMSLKCANAQLRLQLLDLKSSYLLMFAVTHSNHISA